MIKIMSSISNIVYISGVRNQRKDQAQEAWLFSMPLMWSVMTCSPPPSLKDRGDAYDCSNQLTSDIASKLLFRVRFEISRDVLSFVSCNYQ